MGGWIQDILKKVYFGTKNDLIWVEQKYRSDQIRPHILRRVYQVCCVLTKGTFVHSVKLTILYKQAIQMRCKLTTFWRKWLPPIVFCISHKRSAFSHMIRLDLVPFVRQRQYTLPYQIVGGLTIEKQEI